MGRKKGPTDEERLQRFQKDMADEERGRLEDAERLLNLKGVLYKRTKRRKWKTVWLVLEDGVLYIYKSERFSEKSLSREIVVSQCVVEVATNIPGHDNTFFIRPRGGGFLLLEADNPDALSEWMEALALTIETSFCGPDADPVTHDFVKDVTYFPCDAFQPPMHFGRPLCVAISPASLRIINGRTQELEAIFPNTCLKNPHIDQCPDPRDKKVIYTFLTWEVPDPDIVWEAKSEMDRLKQRVPNLYRRPRMLLRPLETVYRIWYDNCPELGKALENACRVGYERAQKYNKKTAHQLAEMGERDASDGSHSRSHSRSPSRSSRSHSRSLSHSRSRSPSGSYSRSPSRSRSGSRSWSSRSNSSASSMD